MPKWLRWLGWMNAGSALALICQSEYWPRTLWLGLYYAASWFVIYGIWWACAHVRITIKERSDEQ